MEASVLQCKKPLLKKGKLKKTVKNLICRPDSAKTWPGISDTQANLIIKALEVHKVDIPEFKKPHWKELKSIPKKDRPKEPKLKKVDGLIFGASQCSNSIISGECSAVIIEYTVNPRMIVQPVIENCIRKDIPVVCLQNLRKYSQTYFGIPTSCLGIKNKYLEEISKIVKDVYPKHKVIIENVDKPKDILNNESVDTKTIDISEENTSSCPYLFRDDKKTRVFVPSGTFNNKSQDYIKIPSETVLHSKQENTNSYMKMMLKKVTNNPNRKRKICDKPN